MFFSGNNDEKTERSDKKRLDIASLREEIKRLNDTNADLFTKNALLSSQVESKDSSVSDILEIYQQQKDQIQDLKNQLQKS